MMENFPNIGIVVQARTGSTRMPNKMITKFYKEMTLIELILYRIKKSFPDLPIILATTTLKRDDILEQYAKNIGVLTFRGSEDNVLDRFICAAENFNINKIIRICADNPLLDLNALRYQIEQFRKNNVDYWCYSLMDETPTIKTHYGFWGEAVKLETLKFINSSTTEKKYLEHVTNYIYENKNTFKIHYEPIGQEIEKIRDIRLTIDTEDDFNLTRDIFQEIMNHGTPLIAEKIIAFIISRPDWRKIMELQIRKNEK